MKNINVTGVRIVGAAQSGKYRLIGVRSGCDEIFDITIGATELVYKYKKTS